MIDRYLPPMGYQLSTADISAIKNHLLNDEVLRPIIEQLPFPKERIQLSEAYPALLRSIVGQQVSVQAAAAIYKRFLVHFDLDPDDGKACPSPAVLAKADKESLRNLGFSYNKAQYVINIAEYWLAHPEFGRQIDSLSDQAIIEALTSIKGVGVWTVEMMLIFALGRRDVLPLDDLAIFKSIQELYKLEQAAPKRQLKQEMTRIAEAWRPYRSAATLYLYAYRGAKKAKVAFTL